MLVSQSNERKYTMRENKTQKVAIGDDVHRELKIYCAVAGCKLNAALREAVEDFLRKHK